MSFSPSKLNIYSFDGTFTALTVFFIYFISVFKELQKESEFQRKEWFRKQGTGLSVPFYGLVCHLSVIYDTKVFMLVTGPHFIEYLSYEVTPECCVILQCKVRLGNRDVSGCPPCDEIL